MQPLSYRVAHGFIFLTMQAVGALGLMAKDRAVSHSHFKTVTGRDLS